MKIRYLRIFFFPTSQQVQVTTKFHRTLEGDEYGWHVFSSTQKPEILHRIFSHEYIVWTTSGNGNKKKTKIFYHVSLDQRPAVGIRTSLCLCPILLCGFTFHFHPHFQVLGNCKYPLQVSGLNQWSATDTQTYPLTHISHCFCVCVRNISLFVPYFFITLPHFG